MKKLGDKSLPENVYSLDSDESEMQCFSDVHGACGDGGTTTQGRYVKILDNKDTKNIRYRNS